MNTILRSITITVLLAVLALPARTQFSVGADVGTMIDDNVDNNTLRLNDRITALGLQAGYDWITDDTNIGLAYLGSYNYYSVVPGRSYQTHTGSLTYARLFGNEDQTLWSSAASFGIRTDREEYEYYDNTTFAFSTALKHQLGESVLGRAGYTLRTMSFANLPAFDYTEHLLFVQSSFFLPSRTTLIAEVDLGVKVYSTPNEDTTGALTAGRGRMSSSLSSPGVAQATGMLRIGQSVFQNTGLSLTGSWQVNLRREARFLTSDYGLVSDDEIFEDHYGYQGPGGSLMLTQILPLDMKLRVTGSWQRRGYTPRAAYNEVGVQIAPERIDNRRALNVSLHIPVTPAGFTLGVAFDHIVNASNDPFFSYTNNAFTVQLTIP